MKKPVKSDMNLEMSVQPLIAALKIPKLSDACRILFVNGDGLALSAELQQMGIVILEGTCDGSSESAALIMSDSQTQLIRIVQNILPSVIDKLTGPIVSASIEMASIKDENKRQSVFVAKFTESTRNEEGISNFFKTLLPYVGGAIKPIAELLIGSLYKFYYGRYENQHQVIAGFDDVTISLRRCGLLSPFLRLAICSNCNNYELAFSKMVKPSPTCSKCGSNWSILTINEFPSSFADLKRKNGDLPVFISAYLKSKSALPIDVFPNAEFNLEKGSVEVDVAIPDTLTGIECKCYANNLAVTQNTINSEAGNIKRQIENYLLIGLKRVVVITNYSEDDTNNLRTALQVQVQEVKGLTELKVVGCNLTEFAQFLDDELGRIEKVLTHRMQKRLEGEVKKHKSEGFDPSAVFPNQ